jgi:hypothetical protein
MAHPASGNLSVAGIVGNQTKDQPMVGRQAPARESRFGNYVPTTISVVPTAVPGRSKSSIVYGPEGPYCPARPLFTRTLTSTRRFSARPCADSLVAVGSAVPIAPGATTCRTGTLQSWIK